jgi:hypothetical protein
MLRVNFQLSGFFGLFHNVGLDRSWKVLGDRPDMHIRVFSCPFQRLICDVVCFAEGIEHILRLDVEYFLD